MNKEYSVDDEGKVTVLTDTCGRKLIERKDKYTKNTDEILSLENVVEALENKINIFETKIKETKLKKADAKKSMVSSPLIAFLTYTLTALVYALIWKSPKLFGLLGPAWIIVTTITEIIGLILLKIYNKKIEKYQQKITDESLKIKKINKRIETLSKDKTPIKKENPYQFEEVKQIYNFNFAPSDYFIERYQVDKRTKEMNKGKKKVKKVTKKITGIDNNFFDYN